MLEVQIATCTCDCDDCVEDGVCFCDCLPEGHPDRADYVGELSMTDAFQN